MNDGILKSRPPKPSLSISRRTLMLMILLLSLAVSLSLVLGRKEKKEHEREDEGHAPPNQAVTLLPSSYADLSPPPPLKPPPRIYESHDSELMQALLAQALEKKKREDSARLSAVTFQGLTVPYRALGERGALSSEDEFSREQRESPRDDVNRQDDKVSFLRKTRSTDVRLSERLLYPESPYELLSGSLIPGVLLTGINSDLPGELLGQVSENVFDTVSGLHLLIPQGTRILGRYDSRIVYGQERVLVVWTRLIFPNGSSISLLGMPGVDLSGYAGLSDKVDNHYARLLSGVVFSSLLGAAAQISEGRTYNTTNPSYGELSLQGIARNTNQVGQEITRRNLNIQPTLIIRPGFRFNVFVHKDITLAPYEEK